MVALIDGLSKGDNELLKYKVAIHTMASVASVCGHVGHMANVARRSGRDGHAGGWVPP